MPTHIDGHCTRPATYSSSNDRPQSLWPDKMLRTYLWALEVQSESSLSGHESDSGCDYDYSSFGAHSSVRVNTARCSFRQWDEMAQTSLSDVYCSSGKLLDASRAFPLHREQCLRRVAKSCTDLRLSLPDSPLQPRVIRSRAPSPSPSPVSEQASNTGVVAPKLMELVRYSDAAVRKTRPRGGTMFSAPRAPAIVLSPSTPDSSSQSFSSNSSDSEFASAPVSTIPDDCTSTSSESIPSYVEGKIRDVYQRGLAKLRTIHKSEVLDAPTHPLSEAHFKLIRQLCMQMDQLVITVDLSECTSELSPGKHGWVFPHVTTLRNALTSHAVYSPEGSHVFSRRETDREAQYEYCGYYKLKIGAKSIFRAKTETSRIGSEDQGVFFFTFANFDKEIVSLIKTLASPVDEPQVPLYPSTFGFEVKRKTSRPQTRVVNVEGVDFEMATSPVAWDHGSFREYRRDF